MDIEKLVEIAKTAREKAYTPYSKFKVGAAVMTKDGKVYSGCNIENASYGLSICAERTAIFKAVSNGERELEVLALIGDTKEPTSPCGACRQVIQEFGIKKIIMSNLKGDIMEMSSDMLLPCSFSSKDL